MRVTVVGDALLDVAVATHEAPRPGADIPAEVRIGPGGQGSNVAVRLARLGSEVTLVCGLADDAAGRLLTDRLATEGVRLAPVPVPSTGSVVILVDARGERTMLSHRAPFAAGVAAALPVDADWIVVSGYVLAEADAGAAVDGVAGRAARRALLGCAVAPDRVDGWRADAGRLRPDLLVANDDEARVLDGVAPSSALVVTTTADGATASQGSREIAATRTAGAAVDTTGAGDALAATLVNALGAWPPSVDAVRAALDMAVARATAVASLPGAQARVAGEGSGAPGW